jgi:hypothetical protein
MLSLESPVGAFFISPPFSKNPWEIQWVIENGENI